MKPTTTGTMHRREMLVAGAAGLAASALGPSLRSFAKETSNGVEDLSAAVEKRLKETDVPAAAVAVIAGGELRAAGVAGVRKRGHEANATIDDKFHIGSCTKAMTATLVGKLVERGDLSWEATIAELFEGFDVHEGYRDVTVRRLLAHVGGVPYDTDDAIWRRLWNDRKLPPRRSREILVSATLAAPPREKPTEFHYSNTGYSIVGVALERKLDVAWEELLTKEIFEPLGMTSAGFGAPAAKNQVDHPWGHHPDPVPPLPHGDNPPAIGPGGTVHCSIRDWAKFIRLHLGCGPADIVSKETLEILHEPVEGSDGYALGWRTTKRPWSDGTVLTHNGTNTMNFAVAWLAPEERFAVVAACNQGRDAAEGLCDALSSYAVGRYA